MKPQIKDLSLIKVNEDKTLSLILDVLLESKGVFWRDIVQEFNSYSILCDLAAKGGVIRGILVEDYLITHKTHAKYLIKFKSNFYSFMYFSRDFAIFKRDKYREGISIEIFTRGY